MALEARVKDHYRWSSVVALDGVEFIKSEWRPVPMVREDEAKRTAFLEVREVEEAKIKIKVEAESVAEVAPAEEPKAPAKKKKPAKKKPKAGGE